MQYDTLIDWRCILIVQLTIMFFSMSPDISLRLWGMVTRQWRLMEARRVYKQRIEAERKLKKYWAIDMKEFK